LVWGRRERVRDNIIIGITSRFSAADVAVIEKEHAAALER
jgi:hypothetical protein